MLRPNRLHPAPYEKPPREFRGWKGNRWIPFLIGVGVVALVFFLLSRTGLQNYWFETRHPGEPTLRSPLNRPHLVPAPTPPKPKENP